MPLLYDFSPVDLAAAPVSLNEVSKARVVYRDGLYWALVRFLVATLVPPMLFPSLNAVDWFLGASIPMVVGLFAPSWLGALSTPTKAVRLAGGNCPISREVFEHYKQILIADRFSDEAVDFITRMVETKRGTPTNNEMTELLKHVIPPKDKTKEPTDHASAV